MKEEGRPEKEYNTQYDSNVRVLLTSFSRIQEKTQTREKEKESNESLCEKGGGERKETQTKIWFRRRKVIEEESDYNESQYEVLAEK